jgi:hypothetical protein
LVVVVAFLLMQDQPSRGDNGPVTGIAIRIR